MNRSDAETVLRYRSQLTSQPYGPDTRDAWAEALSDISEADAKRAMRDLTARGEKQLTVPLIVAQLRWERDAGKRVAEQQHATPECSCGPDGFCPTHQEAARSAIAAIRAERGWTA